MEAVGDRRRAERAVAALNAAFKGPHAGFRAAHAKGTLCKGTFTATPEAASLTRAAHMQGKPVPVTVRFSNSSGKPTHPDGAASGRGMAVTFHLPDGSRTDIVATRASRFFARSPEEFIEVISAGRPGRLRLLRLAFALLTHPRAVWTLRSELRQPPPRSYATCRYNGLHAFKWLNDDAEQRWLRYSWLPEAGEATLPAKEAEELHRDYLQAEIRERLEREPVRFTLRLQLAADGDPRDDPTVAWPEERDTVAAGTLELTGLETGGDALIFDPNRVVDGIEPSDDPVLRFRSEAYAVSAERRGAG